MELGPLRTDYHLRSLYLDTTTPFVQAAPTGTDCNGSRFDTGAKQLYVCINSKFAKANFNIQM